MLVVVTFLLAAEAPAANAVAVAPAVVTFRSRKSLPQLEKCLTDRLSQLGQVTSVPIEDAKTLMLSTSDEPPMMIDIAPPVVKVTTKFAIGSKPIIKDCL